MFLSRRNVLFLALAAVLSASGCTYHISCPGANWREIGYQAAMIGTPVGAFDHYRELCAEAAPPADRDAWSAGHADGNRAYCRPEHAYDQGYDNGFDDMGVYFPEQCPSELAAELKAQFKRGERCGELARRRAAAWSYPVDDEESIDALSWIIAEAIVGAIFDEESEWERLECY